MKTRNIVLSIGLVLGIFLFLISNVSAAQNPAAVYCKEMNYSYTLENTASGQEGFCTLPDKTKCDEWNFFNGDCGKKYSYCSKKGYSFKLNINNSDPLLKKVPICLISDDRLSKFFWIFKIKQGYRESSEIEIMNITNKIIGRSEKKVETTLLNNTYLTSLSNSGSVESSSVSLLQTDLCSGVFCDPTNDNETDSNQCNPATGLCSMRPRLPLVFDWRNYNGSNWMTPVKNQGTCGSCYIFSTVGAVEAKFQINLNDNSLNPDLSEQQYLSCNSFNDSCDGGSSQNVANYLANFGLIDDSLYPYIGSKDTCNLPANWSLGAHKVMSYQTQFFNDVDLTARRTKLQEFIMNNGPVVASIPAWNHAVVLTGWDSTSNLFYFKNSWGTGWGSSGYGTISIDELGTSFFYMDNTDYDADNSQDGLDKCPLNNGNWCNGCSKPICQYHYYPFCSVNNAPACLVNTTVKTIISNCTELQDMRFNLTNNYFLGNDIDCSETKNWTMFYQDFLVKGFLPIGMYDSFRGNFDGQGHLIYDLYINTALHAGLFDNAKIGSEIKNVGLINVNISGWNSVGSIVGKNGYNSMGEGGAKISNSYATGNVRGYDYYTGGLIGQSALGYGLSDSYFEGNVSGVEYVGGLVGYNIFYPIYRSYSTGIVNGSYIVGGLVGDTYGDNIESSFTTSFVSGNDLVGTVVGNNRGTGLIVTYWNNVSSKTPATCVGQGTSQTSCYPIQNNLSYFYDSNNLPFVFGPSDWKWDFNNVWYSLANNLPQLEVFMPKCFIDSDCGTNGPIGDLFCNSNSVARNYISFTCNNPGTRLSYCSNFTQSFVNQTCPFECDGGVCLYNSSSNWCYQESANTINQTGIDGDCKLNYNGSYYTTDNGILGYFYINYTKPAMAISSSIWKVKEGILEVQNITLPPNCWNQKNLMFKMTSNNFDADSYCYNGTNWDLLVNGSSGDNWQISFDGDALTDMTDGDWTTSGQFTTPLWVTGGIENGRSYGRIYEEAMIWAIGKNTPTQELQLYTGWNTLTFTILPENKSLLNVLSSINGKYSQIKTQDSDGNIQMWDESMPDFSNDLTEINYNQTYMINMKENTTLNIIGYSE